MANVYIKPKPTTKRPLIKPGSVGWKAIPFIKVKVIIEKGKRNG